MKGSRDREMFGFMGRMFDYCEYIFSFGKLIEKLLYDEFFRIMG